MAISPPTDIIMDVAKAADPERAAAARARLASTRETAPSGEGFAAAGAAARLEPAGTPRAMPQINRPEAHVKFEAMVLQSFLQSMMPEGEAVYGEGLAGEIWKSMLAEQISTVMARRGGIGIADRMLADHATDGDLKLPLVGHAPDAVEERRGENGLLSAALVEEMQRRLMQSVREDAANGAQGAR